MDAPIILKIDGEVERPVQLTLSDLAEIDQAFQVVDVSRIDPQRQGDAVTLNGVLQLVGVKPTARYLGLHAALDDFHASVPLEPILDRAFFIYQIAGQGLDDKQGGPVRFYIRDFAECRMDELDECANVKFLDHVEFTTERGFDNRPTDDQAHADLHGRSDSK
jgi:hypothetical protein